MKFTIDFEHRDGRLHATLTTGSRVYERMISATLEKSVMTLTDHIEASYRPPLERQQVVTYAGRLATARAIIDRDGCVTTMALAAECRIKREHAHKLLRRMTKEGVLVPLPRRSNGAVEYVRAAVVTPEGE